MENRLKNISIVATISIMVAYSLYHLGYRTYPDFFDSHKETVDGVYFLFTCFAFSSFTAILFFVFNRFRFTSAIFLLCSLFFSLLFLSTVLNWIVNHKILMLDVYSSFIISMVGALIYILIKRFTR